MSEKTIITLCHRCKENFEEAGEKLIQVGIEKSLCTYCNCANGCDYEIRDIRERGDPVGGDKMGLSKRQTV